ncbi:hypothetical protein Acsp04_61020 [Actinomadura sp. NBRC 104425]|uniref:hypothetical protein n=1 Tax=Actinomadura sp. NBRC 104425 TaxID=3032204 RepID=UPI0024A09B29|nr:hypothetical protein [Actinomadura sp. NBRC 104425]GLZ15867.1 hypothetical protein Acsp04_61020 [Actinomadura sp. NBRC 104425]
MDDRTDVPDSYNPLAALGQKLAMRGLTVDHMLHVADATGVSLTITCRPRPEDDGRLWVFTEADEPISEADGVHLDDAVLHVLGHLARRAERAREAAR